MIEQLAPEARDDFPTPDVKHTFTITGEEYKMLDEYLGDVIDELQKRLDVKRGLRRLSPTERYFTSREVSQVRLLRAKLANQQS